MISPVLSLYIRQSLQAKNDKIRNVSALSDVDFEEQEGIYAEIAGEISPISFLENTNIYGAEVRKSRTLSKTDQYYRQHEQSKYKNWKKMSSQSQETELPTLFNFDLQFEESFFSRYTHKYDTMKRQRKKKRLYSHFEDSKKRQYYRSRTKTKSTYLDIESSNFCHIKKKKHNNTILHPYKNEFIVEKDMSTTKLEIQNLDLPGCFENYNKSLELNEHVTNFTALDYFEDSSSCSSGGLLGSPICDKQECFLSPTCHLPNICQSGGFPEECYVPNPEFLIGRMNCDANRLEYSVKETIHSSIEKSKDDYIDTTDELQCLIETVSEYLDEKEEINRVGSHSETKIEFKHNNAINKKLKEKTGNQTPPFTVFKDDKDKLFFPEMKGMKCAVGSLFNSLTEKVGSSTRHLTTSVGKLVYLVPEKAKIINQREKINSESGPKTKSVLEKDLFMQLPAIDHKDIDNHGNTIEDVQTDYKTKSLNIKNATETIGNHSESQNSVIKSVFSMLNPLKHFTEEESTKDEWSKQTTEENFIGCNLEVNHRGDTLDNDCNIVILADSDGRTTNIPSETLFSQMINEPSNVVISESKKDDIESILERIPCEDPSLLSDQSKICVNSTLKHFCTADSRRANKESCLKLLDEDKGTSDDDFLEPLRKSLSLFLLTPPEICSEEILSESLKNHQLEEDGLKRYPRKGQTFPIHGKQHILFPVLSHSEQQDLKEKGSIFPSFKFPFTDSSITVNYQPVYDSAVANNEESQRNCHENLILRSVKTRSVSNIPKNIGKLNCSDEFKKNNQNIFLEAEKINTTCDSVLNISNDLGKFENIEELNPSNCIVVEETEGIPRVVPKEYIPLDLSEKSKNLTQITSLTALDSITSTSAITESALANVIRKDNIVDETYQKNKENFSVLCNKFSSLKNLSTEQELNLRNDSHNRNNISSLASGIFNSISYSRMTDCKPTEVESLSFDGNRALYENKYFTLDEISVTSCVTSENQRNHAKNKVSGSIKSFLPLPKENIPLFGGCVDSSCSPTWKNQQSENCSFSSVSSVLDCAPRAQQGFLEKSLTKKLIPDYVLGVKLHEKSNKLSPLLLNNNILNKSNHCKTFEEMNDLLCYEWDSDTKYFFKNSRELQPIYCILNQNIPSTDLENLALNFDQKDPVENILDWRTNPNGVLWHDLPYESFNQPSLNEDYSLGGHMWASNSLRENSNLNNDSKNLQELPIDLSCSNCETACPIFDQALRINENFVCSSVHCGYQEWLSCLENGVWWPLENGDYGYYMFHDGQYIYSLLTDSTGEYAYLFIPDYYQEYLNWDLQLDNQSNTKLDVNITSPYSFKVFDKEDELLWYIEEEPDPLDLSIVLPRSEELIHINLETFPQSFEPSSYGQRDQVLDFSWDSTKKFKEGFGLSEERFCDSEDLKCTLDFRNHPQTVGFHVLHRDQIIEEDIQPLVQDSSLYQPNIQCPHLYSEEVASLVHLENITNSSQQADEISSLNRVTSLFPTLAALVETTLNFDNNESLESLVMQNIDQQSKSAESTSDGDQSLILSKQLESNSQDEKSLLKKNSEKEIVSNIQQSELTKNMMLESPLSKNIHVKKKNLLKSAFQVSHTTPQTQSGISNDEIIKVDSISVPLTSQISSVEHKNPKFSHDQSSNECERTLLKSALKLFGSREDSSVSLIENEKHESGFFNLLKTPVDKEESSNFKKDADKNRKLFYKKKTSDISNIFGTFGNFFKTNISHMQTTEKIPVFSVTNKNEVKSEPKSEQAPNKGVEDSSAEPIFSKGKVRVRSLNKQNTIDDSKLKESFREIQSINLTEKEEPFRDHLIQQSPNTSFLSSCLNECPEYSSAETSSISLMTEPSGSNEMSFDTLNKKISNKQDKFSEKDSSFSTTPTSSSQPELASKKCLFSFLIGSEKSENRAFPIVSKIKDISKSRSRGFFNLPFFDEKQKTAGGNGLSTFAPVTTHSCKNPSDFVDMCDRITKEDCNEDTHNIVQEEFHEQQIPPFASNSKTIEITSFASEMNVLKNYHRKLNSPDASETCLTDFQVNQLQKDIISCTSGFQAQTEALLTDLETFGVALQKEEILIQETLPNGSLTKSFTQGNHLTEKLNNFDTCTNNYQNESFASESFNLSLEKIPEQILTQNLEITCSSAEPEYTEYFQNENRNNEENQSVLGSSAEMLSGFVSKVKSFSGCLMESPKAFSGFFSSMQPSKKNSLFSLSSGTSSQPLKSELFGIFKNIKPETNVQESPVLATSWLQNDSCRDSVGSVSPKILCGHVSSAVFSSECTLSDCTLSDCTSKSEMEILNDSKIMTEIENNIPGTIKEPSGSEICGFVSFSGDDSGQGILSLSDEGDMGILQPTDTEASMETEHTSLSEQVNPPHSTCVAKEHLPLSQSLSPFDPEPAMQSSSRNQDFLDPQTTDSPEPNTVLPSEVDVSKTATLEIQGNLSHPLLEKSVLYIKKSCGLLDDQRDLSKVPQETEQPRPFSITNMASWTKLNFPSSVTDNGKPLSSLFSPPPSSTNRTVDVGLISSFKKLSTLFEGASDRKENIVVNDPKPRFGKKMDLSSHWLKENKEVHEQMPSEASNSVLVSSHHNLNYIENDKALEPYQMFVTSAESVKACAQPSWNPEQVEAKLSVCALELSVPGKMKKQQEIQGSEHWDLKDNLHDPTSALGSHEENHCTAPIVPYQLEEKEEEVLLANTDSVPNVQHPVILHDIKEPKKIIQRPVLS